MTWINFIALAAVIQYLYFGYQVSMARTMYGVKAPAITGNEAFERLYRVQMNTLEQLVAFLPALYIAAEYWSTTFCGLLGLVYLVGRAVYARAYVKNPDGRGKGFMVSVIPIFLLLLLGLIGVLF
ncbi:MAG: MAPEG family protein [Lautropia sp.]|nr:MAPEG family protein [Lautropia sp.]